MAAQLEKSDATVEPVMTSNGGGLGESGWESYRRWELDGVVWWEIASSSSGPQEWSRMLAPDSAENIERERDYQAGQREAARMRRKSARKREAREKAEKALESRVRRMAERQGLAVTKSRRRDPRWDDYGMYMITNPQTGAVVAGAEGSGLPSMYLDDVEAWLVRPAGEGAS